MPLGDGKLMGEIIGARAPIAGRIVEKAIPAIVEAVRRRPNATPQEVAVAVAPTVREVALEPEVKNATNSEPWYQSRIKIGIIFAFIGLLAEIFGFPFLPEDKQAVLAEALTIGGVGFAGFGRWVKGLAPMRWNPLTWIGLKK